VQSSDDRLGTWVRALIPEGPAAGAGVLVGDAILEVDGVWTADREMEGIVALMRGKKTITLLLVEDNLVVSFLAFSLFSLNCPKR
jgi:C-terminal processing protease CtpA/Prc